MPSFPNPTLTSSKTLFPNWETGPKCVAILTGPSTHLDHLGVLSAILEIPLIVTEKKTFELAKRYYPKCQVVLMEMSDLSLEFLCNHFDVIFESGKFWALELNPFMELLFKKKMRFVFCPHGNSDKGHSIKMHPHQDLSLVYGKHLHDHLRTTGALSSIQSVVATGNYRYPFYQQHTPFYDQIAEEEIFSRFSQKKPILLYAPTWQDRENPTSFFQATKQIIEQLTISYNLIIKLHPFLIEDHLGAVLNMQYHYENHPSAYFLNEFPPIYPLLKRCAIYLGDYSSIGYDFLAFDRPLYFFNPIEEGASTQRYTSLATCGIEIPHSRKNDLNAFFQETLEQANLTLSPMRRQLYAHAFEPEKAPEEIKREIYDSLFKS